MEHISFFVSIICSICITFLVCDGERRILGGRDATVDHTFMVYLRRADLELKNFSAWLCGGAIIGENLVLTSAACVKDITYIYVIAGLKKYVPEKNDTNLCIRKTKRQAIQICVPKAYDLDQEFTKWSALDIAVILVNKPIIGDEDYVTYCDYAPTIIDINLDQEDLQSGGREVITLGWGHNRTWRLENDTKDYNSEKLKYAPSKIVDKKNCSQLYEHLKMDTLINKYMICTLEQAPFDDRGERLNPIDKQKIMEKEVFSDDEGTTNVKEKLPDTFLRRKRRKKIKEAGICQNDHGGPLITWKRSKVVVVGVASVFKVKNQICTGPYLFISTYCTANFLKCVIDRMTRRSMSGFCSLSAQEKGFDIIQRHITWASLEEPTTEYPYEMETMKIEASEEGTGEHENMMDEEENKSFESTTESEATLFRNRQQDGVAETELFQIRPQTPLRDIAYDGK